MLEKIGMVILGIAYFLVAISTISGFGYTLYLWGSEGLNLGQSAWAGFVLFLEMIGTAIVIGVVGSLTLFLGDY